MSDHEHMVNIDEHIVKARLEQKLEDKSRIAANQHGFMKAKSTIQAVEEVKFAEDIRYGFRGRGERWCALVTIAIRSAFNTATWFLILREL